MTANASLRFVPFEDLGDTPHIIVDGAGGAATAITLSHWPKSGTPQALKADTSAEIALNYLAAPAFHVAAKAVSNNHFDEDGLCGIWALLEPETALAMRDLVVDVAQAGDFAFYRDRRAARIAFTISAFADPAFSPLDPALFALPYARQCAALYAAALPRFGDMLEDIDRFKPYWEAEDAALTESEAALQDGRIKIEERRQADLAIVRIEDRFVSQQVHRFADPFQAACHPMAIHNATLCNRILTQQGRRYTLGYRYESWVQFMSRTIPPRVDLNPLAERLSAEERGGAQWVADEVSQITPRLALSNDEESTIAPGDFIEAVVTYLTTAPPAWDPYDSSP